MMIKQRIEEDLKKAMLAGDRPLVEVLRGLKSAILYEEVSEGVRDAGLSNDKVVALLQKEAKKRQDSADLYDRGGSPERQEKELAEKAIIQNYLPEQMSDDEILNLVDEAVLVVGNDVKNMGQIIGVVKQKTAGRAVGAVIARLVKSRLS